MEDAAQPGQEKKEKAGYSKPEWKEQKQEQWGAKKNEPKKTFGKGTYENWSPQQPESAGSTGGSSRFWGRTRSEKEQGWWGCAEAMGRW